ncbi:MAG: 1,4-dihydroxy-6-naphthoate synthase [Saprospiraceae bacterium]
MRDPVHDLYDEGSQIHVAFSPCPNDTFMMDAFVHHKIPHSIPLQTHFLDIQALNSAALNHQYAVSKISVATLPLISDQYQLLESGAAMGFGCGPILVSKKEIRPDEMEKLMFAIPGKNTTAHYLFNHFFPKAQRKKFMVFSDIEAAINSGEVDAGVLIHEGRFTYATRGLLLNYDLGALWEKQYQLPIPLGVFVANKSLGQKKISIIEEMIRKSIEYAFLNPDDSRSYVLAHSQELSPEVVKQHIDLYVNEYSIDLGVKGHQAINFLLSNTNTIPKSN